MSRFVLLSSFFINVLVFQGQAIPCSDHCPYIERFGKIIFSCCVNDLASNNSTDVEQIQFPEEKVLTLLNANITILSPQILSRMREVVHLNIQFGNFREVHIKPSLKTLLFTYTNFERLVIDRSLNYNIQVLKISDMEIRNVPEHIGHLQNLRVVEICQGKIIHLDLAVFKDLKKLEKLAIEFSSLIEVTTSVPIDFPNLKKLELSGNYLTQLDISQWTMPNLNNLHLGMNLLKRIDHLSDKFPNLEWIGLRYNDFDCEWVAKDLSKLFERGSVHESISAASDWCNVSHSSYYYQSKTFHRKAIVQKVDF